MKDDKKQPDEKKKEENFPGYPKYPASEDIYSQATEETEVDPEFPDQKKSPIAGVDEPSELNFKDKTGGDLDVPGSELDDQQEEIGSEDEENNYYSLGGDKED